jgi:WD40 repeat protein
MRYITVFILLSFLMSLNVHAQSGRVPITVANIDQLQPLGTVGRSNGYADVEWSPDGSQFAVASRAGVLLFDRSDLRAAPRILSFPNVYEDAIDVAYSADGHLIAAGVEYGSYIPIWEVSTGILSIQLALPDDFEAASIIFSPNGVYLAALIHRSTAYDETATLGVWNIADTEPLKIIEDLPRNLPSGMVFSEDSEYLIYRDNRQLTAYELQEDIATEIRFAPDRPGCAESYYFPLDARATDLGENWFAMQAVNSLIICNETTGERFSIGEFISDANAFAFSPDGTQMITVRTEETDHGDYSSSAAIDIWEVDSFLNGETTPTETLLSPGFSGSYTGLDSAGRLINLDGALWDLVDLREHYIVSEAIQTSPDLTLSAAREGETLAPYWGLGICNPICPAYRTRLWNTATTEEVGAFEGQRIVFSPDNQTLVIMNENTTTLWDVTTAQPRTEIGGTSGRPVYSPDSRLVVVHQETDSGTNLLVWDVEIGDTRLLAENLPLSEDCIFGGRCAEVRFSHDSSLLIWNESNHVPYLVYDVQSGQLLYALRGDFVTEIIFSPDNRLLALAESDAEQVSIYDARTGQLQTVFPYNVGILDRIQFSADSEQILIAGGAAPIQIWDIATEQLIIAIQPEPEWVLDAVLSPQGDLVMARVCEHCESDHQAVFYETTTGTEVARLTGGRFYTTPNWDLFVIMPVFEGYASMWGVP